MRWEKAESQSYGAILMVGIAVILAILVFLLTMGMISFDFFSEAITPDIIRIVGVNHGGSLLESQVVIRSYAQEELDNDMLMARLKVNGKELLACIYSLNGYNFIPTHHFGVKLIKGAGCSGQYFSPYETITIDLKNGHIKPGDMVELFVYRKSSGDNPPAVGVNILDRESVDEYLAERIFNQKKDYRLYSKHLYTA